MAYRNYINLSDKEKDKPIYRIFPIARFIQLLTTKKLTLVKPKKWDDPFENILLSSRFAISGEIAEISARDSVYGQCWTWHRETDAMWRIYSPSKDGVRLKSTPRKLLTALKKECGAHSDVQCFIGSVKYIAKSKMEGIFEFSLDISTTFDRILFDPRMSEDLRKSYSEAVKALGFNAEIKRSTLYDPPKQLTFK